MANMVSCACGWTVVSPVGADDVKKHLLLHLHDIHPGTTVREDEIKAMIRAL